MFVKPGTCLRGRPSKRKSVRATNASGGIEGFDADGAYRLVWNGFLFVRRRGVTTTMRMRMTTTERLTM